MVYSVDIELVPAGVREFCPPRYPGEQIHPFIIKCEVQSNLLGWFVMIGYKGAPISVSFTNESKPGPVQIYRGIEASQVMTKSVSSVASFLNVSVPLRTLPITLYCGVNFQRSKILTLLYKSKWN